MKGDAKTTDEKRGEGRRSFLKQLWRILGLVAAAELVFFIISLYLKTAKI